MERSCNKQVFIWRPRCLATPQERRIRLALVSQWCPLTPCWQAAKPHLDYPKYVASFLFIFRKSKDDCIRLVLWIQKNWENSPSSPDCCRTYWRNWTKVRFSTQDQKSYCHIRRTPTFNVAPQALKKASLSFLVAFINRDISTAASNLWRYFFSFSKK